MRPDFFHRNLVDLAALGTLFSGLTLALLVGFAKRPNQPANLFLSLALGVIVLKTGGLSAAFLPALGPLLFLYTKHLTQPEWRFQRNDWLHFCPLLVGYWMPVWLVFISVTLYLYSAHRLIQAFYGRLQPVLMDRPRFAFRGLDNALIGLGWSCLLTLVSDSFFLAMAFVLMGMAVEVILQSDSPVQLVMPIADRSDARQKGRKLKEVVAANHLYEDAELTLTTLAVKLAIHPHELSRIINVGLDKNFSDFINEFRVRETARKMRDPAYDRLTLLGIAYESGFNSKTTFNRVFKEMTGKTPVEYKNSVKKEVPIDKLALRSPIQPLLLRSGSPLTKATEISNRTIASVHPLMLRNYFKIAFRTLSKNKSYSAINIGGLAVGMAVAVLIGLWVYDELSFDQGFPNYDRIAQIRHLGTEPSTGVTESSESCQIPLANALKANYGLYFKHILLGFWPGDFTVAAGQKKYTQKGKFIEGGVIDMLSLQMLSGSRAALDDPHGIILSQSAAEAIFGHTDPLGKALKLDNRMDVTVRGVYANLPRNSTYGNIQFFAPWALWVSSNDWVQQAQSTWGNSSFQIDVQIADHTSMEAVDAALNDFYPKNVPPDLVAGARAHKLELYLYPMRQWHLYSEFKNGRPSGGRITFVWLFSLVGGFVLLLACINFMNLSTARSEKRAKEVGIRKAVGSVKSQLVNQFLSESLLVVSLAFVGALVLVTLSLSWFNELADKAIVFPGQVPAFWLASLLFLAITALLAGLYPAFYLSSFQPINALKGTFRTGRLASLPRQVLVVVQFVVSVVLIIGVLIVYKQIQYVNNRPVGYERAGLLSIPMNDPNYKGKEEVMERELMETGMVSQVAFSSSPLTNVWRNVGGFEWDNKAPKAESSFAVTDISHQFGRMAGWHFLAGRDFSKAFATDSGAVIINETAARYLGLKKRNGQWPVGAYIRQPDIHRKHQIIGVIKDMVMDSPFEPVMQSFYFLDPTYSAATRLNLRLKPTVSAPDALPKIEAVIRQTVPSALFTYSFVDQDFAAKFSTEQRIGKLSSVFAGLAILISCLGILGLASFVAEQRTKEIGVRKVLGASVMTIWTLLSGDFVWLVSIAFVVASPLAWYVLHGWLGQYTYHTELSWWVFAVAGVGTLAITLLTVSFQSLKAALMNPVKSLRSE